VLSPIGSNTIQKVKITLYLLFTPQKYPIWGQCLYGFPYKSSFARCSPGEDGAKAAGIAMASMRSRRAEETAFSALRHGFGAGMAGMVCSVETARRVWRGLQGKMLGLKGENGRTLHCLALCDLFFKL